ncbi:uncharacterized protein ASPGLDRAFT_22956 [Aspergillus glaucus CBS 516.65]|uniref:DUF3669 domain-containing protein n=1 Tax=Aspergillus glaucus CBS 516.65 TaxID=1160497 RepID=A0A1L9VSK1_ASPGL|nr:hypothetical protein ASPGLDRAFT_22956 [Aspergillus glaucus CBS 516.65]OJJ86876.1 hypothetical protein ASPGLDRAFT_22956 [Aspergillus glaucus CBS 516.65]
MEEQYLPEFHCLGRGSCGSACAESERGSAFKREDGSTSRSSQNDFGVHRRVLESINRLMEIKKTRILPAKRDGFPQIQVPECRNFVPPRDHWWTANVSRFRADYQPCNALESQRIPPFPDATRDLLIQNYRTPENRHQASAHKANHDCLIRPYLGRKYSFHVDQMEDIGLSSHDISFYARTLAEALATLYWIGKVYGNDVEFVLAPPDGQQREDTMSNILDMGMDEEGVRKAVRAY